MRGSAYLVVAHGARDPEGRRSFRAMLQNLQGMFPERIVEGVILEGTEADIAGGVEKCAARGCRQIFVLPLLSSPQKYLTNDIPLAIQKAREKFPGLDFHFSHCLADDTVMIRLLRAQGKGFEEKVDGKIEGG